MRSAKKCPEISAAVRDEIRINGKWYIMDAQSGFFLAGSNIWKNMMGMRWNTKGPPKCSASDHKKFGFYGSIE